MTTFLQLHLLTSYPPACLNRDDLNRPKTAIMGGVPRLRISSQSLKRAWRTSEQFEEALSGHMGTRTKRMGTEVYERLTAAGIGEKEAREWTREIAGRFGKLKNKKEKQDTKEEEQSTKKEKSLIDLEIEQLAHFSPEEEGDIQALTSVLAEEKRAPTKEELNLLRKRHKAADIALFGRMLADEPAYNTEAACQVAHAVSVHRAAVEDDFFTAVDDLNKHEEDAGSAHMGEQGFGAGLFYQYVCIDCDRLRENLGSDVELATKTIAALIEAAATVAPGGKQNSFASRAWAYYVLAEKGDRQPRSLSLAFMKPIAGSDMLRDAVTGLTTMRDNLDKVYYQKKSLDSRNIDATAGEGDFEALKSWAASYGNNGDKA